MLAFLSTLYSRIAEKLTRGRYDNPHAPGSDKAIAWDKGRNATDWSKNPYPPKSAMWRAWKRGDYIRQCAESNVW